MRADISTAWLESPIGMLRVQGDENGIAAVTFTDENERDAKGSDAIHPIVSEAVAQLTQYFEGKRSEFSLPLAPGGTDFQQSVWKLLLTIPSGGTSTYSELARKLGNPGSVRAVGTANGANPIAIIVPCHRVIGADGSLTGYAGGIARKEWLLAHEARHWPQGQLPLF